MQEKTYQIGGIVLNYAEGPNNGAPILLVHGNMSRWQVFSSIIPALTSNMHVFALDLRGHGKSSHLTGTYTLQNHLNDVVSFIKNIIGMPVILVGNSLGGMIGLMTAAHYPELVQSIIIADSPLTLETLEPILKSQMDLGKQLIDYKNANQNEELYRTINDDFSAESMWICDTDVIKTTFNHYHEMLVGYDIEKLLPLITSPLLIIRGQETLGSMISDHDIIKATELCSQLTQQKLEDVGHAVLSQKEIILKNIISFLNNKMTNNSYKPLRI